MRKEILFYLPIFILTSCAQNRPSSTHPIEPTTEVSIYTKKDQYEDYKNAGGSLSFFEWQVTVLGEDPNGYQRYGTYVVYFLDGDDNIITHSVVEPGMPAIYDGGKPTKSDLNNNGTITKFIFSKWDNDFDNINSNMVIHALFEEDPNKYFEIKFEDYDGKLLSSSILEEGEFPTPPESPSRERQIDGNLITDYKFYGWDKSIDQVHAPTIYKAVYSENRWEGYTVTWKAPDGHILKTGLYQKGSSVKYNEGSVGEPYYYDQKYNYVFESWDKEVNNLLSDTIVNENAIKIPLSMNGNVESESDNLLVSDQKIITILKSQVNSYELTYGDIVTYNGKNYTYDRDDIFYEREPVQWHIIKKNERKILLMTDPEFRFRHRNNKADFDSLNEYLNNEFIKETLYFQDKSRILTTYLDNSMESRMIESSSVEEPSGTGKIFLLSAYEFSENLDTIRSRVMMTHPFFLRSYCFGGEHYRAVAKDWIITHGDDCYNFCPCLWFSLD